MSHYKGTQLHVMSVCEYFSSFNAQPTHLIFSRQSSTADDCQYRKNSNLMTDHTVVNTQVLTVCLRSTHMQLFWRVHCLCVPALAGKKNRASLKYENSVKQYFHDAVGFDTYYCIFGEFVSRLYQPFLDQVIILFVTYNLDVTT